MLKMCKICKEEKDISEFTVKNKKTDNRYTGCKPCRYQQRVESFGGPDGYREMQRKAYHTRWKERLLKTCKAYSKSEKGRKVSRDSYKNWVSKNPEKYKAHKAVKKAIANGSLVRSPCEVCGQFKLRSDGRSAIQAHHDDYSKPLEIIWLCHDHHAERHVWLREQQRKEA